MQQRRLGLAWGICLFSAFMAVGCSRLPSLTSAQEAQVRDTLQSSFRTVNSVPSPKTAPVRISPVFEPVFGRFLFAEVGSQSEDLIQSRMSDRLTDAMMAGDCRVKVTVPDSGTLDLSNLKTNASTQVSGDACPVELNFSTGTSGNLSASSGSMTFDVNWTFRVKDSAFADLNDVDLVDFRMNMSASGTSSSGTGKVDGGGRIHSRANGDVLLKISGDLEGNAGGSQMELRFRMTYPSFVAEFRIKTEGNRYQASNRYFVNDDEVTKDQFSSYFTTIRIRN